MLQTLLEKALRIEEVKIVEGAEARLVSTRTMKRGARRQPG